jgi:DNA primase
MLKMDFIENEDLTLLILNFDLYKFLLSNNIEEIKEIGENYIFRCPFHLEKNPSFGIHKVKKIYGCFSCGEKGNLVSFISKVLKISFADAVNYLKNENNLYINDNLEFYLDRIKNKIKEKDEKILKNDYEDMFYLDESILNNYSLKNDYLLKRGFLQSTCDFFNFGFTNDWYPTHDERITIPVRNEKNKLVGIIGRKIDEYSNNEKYLNTYFFPRGKVLYNLNNIKEYDKVLLVEGPLDVAKCVQNGFENTVCSFGVMVTKTQEEILYKFNKIYLMFDNDKAGKMLQENIKNRLKFKTDVFVCDLERYKDPCEINERDILLKILDKAKFWFYYKEK